MQGGISLPVHLIDINVRMSQEGNHYTDVAFITRTLMMMTRRGRMVRRMYGSRSSPTHLHTYIHTYIHAS